MNEQEQNTKTKKRTLSKEKRFYLLTAIGSAVALAVILVVTATVSKKDVDVAVTPPQTENSSTIDKPTDENNTPALPEGMILPTASGMIANDYGFWHNQTLNNYYEHTGMDFLAEEGAEVLAVDNGKVESIYKEDLLLGTQIVIAHDNGLKSVYRFVNEAENLKVGDEVEKGQVIATVAQATGDEYKEGPHLHFEIWKENKVLDPNDYLTLDEK